MGIQGLQDCPPLAVPQTAVAGGPATADNRALTEDGHPRDWSADYATWSGDTPHSSYCNWEIDLDVVEKLEVRGTWTQLAATGDGAIRIYDNDSASAFTPTSVTIPQGTTVTVDQIFTRPGGASGKSDVELQHQSGQSGVNIRRHGGVHAREIFE